MISGEEGRRLIYLTRNKNGDIVNYIVMAKQQNTRHALGKPETRNLQPCKTVNLVSVNEKFKFPFRFFEFLGRCSWGANFFFKKKLKLPSVEPKPLF